MNLKIIVMGPVGSGKSTQATLLARHFKIPHLEMGELLRKISQKDEKLRKILASGKFVPDGVVMKILAGELKKEDYQQGVVVDGIPRTINQAKSFPFVPEVVIYLCVEDSENIKRLLLRGRQDDTEEIIKKRLAIYHKQTLPVLDFYRKQGKLFEVDGEPAIEVIFKDILQKLEERDLK